MRQTCSVPGCDTMLKTHDAQRLGLCWAHRGPRRSKAGAPDTGSGTERARARASAKTRHPSSLVDLDTAFPCFLHGTKDKWTCEGCLRNGELDYETRGWF